MSSTREKYKRVADDRVSPEESYTGENTESTYWKSNFIYRGRNNL